MHINIKEKRWFAKSLHECHLFNAKLEAAKLSDGYTAIILGQIEAAAVGLNGLRVGGVGGIG